MRAVRDRALRPLSVFALSCSIFSMIESRRPLGAISSATVAGGARVAGEPVEQVREVLADLRVAGEQAEVLVLPRRLRVVVPGADVRVAAQLAALLAHHQGQLAVRLEAHQAVDDVAAGLLERARPDDVGVLVEPGLDLDQDEHLLARLGRVHQGVHDRRVAAGAVERLLDRAHVGVGGGLLEERLHRGGERVVGMVQQDVALAHRARTRRCRCSTRTRPGPGAARWRTAGTSARGGPRRRWRTAR